VKEETGLKTKVKKLLFVDEGLDEDRRVVVTNITFLGEIIGGDLNPKPEGDFREARFIDVNQLNEINFYPRIAVKLLKELASTKLTIDDMQGVSFLIKIGIQRTCTNAKCL
jgi:ADP-ribose pyrophosphatase YjhB (NUDIX family)